MITRPNIKIQCDGPCLVIWHGSMLWTLSSVDEPIANGYARSIDDIMQCARIAAARAEIPWEFISIVRIERVSFYEMPNHKEDGHV